MQRIFQKHELRKIQSEKMEDPPQEERHGEINSSNECRLSQNQIKKWQQWEKEMFSQLTHIFVEAN